MIFMPMMKRIYRHKNAIAPSEIITIDNILSTNISLTTVSTIVVVNGTTDKAWSKTIKITSPAQQYHLVLFESG